MGDKEALAGRQRGTCREAKRHLQGGKEVLAGMGRHYRRRPTRTQESKRQSGVEKTGKIFIFGMNFNCWGR